MYDMIDNNRFAYFLNVMHYCIWRGDIRVGHVLYKVIGGFLLVFATLFLTKKYKGRLCAHLANHEKETHDYFYNKKHQTVEIIKLNGSIELAPIVGLSEVIVDIVETGATLRENGLLVLEEVCPLSARMVVNQVSMKMENERITKIIEDLRKLLGGN